MRICYLVLGLDALSILIFVLLAMAGFVPGFEVKQTAAAVIPCAAGYVFLRLVGIISIEE